MGAPVGNTNAAKQNRLWGETLRRAVTQSDGKTLRELADKLIEQAAAGDVQALKEIGDRLDGKARQQVELSGDASAPLTIHHKVG